MQEKKIIIIGAGISGYSTVAFKSTKFGNDLKE